MRFYKYLHPDRIDILRNGTIRFSSPRVLNDPFELKPHIAALASIEEIHSDFDTQFLNILADEYVKLPANFRSQIPLKYFQELAKAQTPELKVHLLGLTEMAVPRLQSLMTESFEEMLGILCLTESPDNLLMWAHYADSHQGFVIEFDVEVPFFDQRKSNEDEFRHLRKVIYQEQRPSLVLSEITNFSPFLTKGVDWSYEAEWRMMLPLSSASLIIGEGPTAVHLYEFPKSAIKSVILGCRIQEAKALEIRQVLHNTDEFKDVVCQQAKIDETRYGLTFSTSYN